MRIARSFRSDNRRYGVFYFLFAIYKLHFRLAYLLAHSGSNFFFYSFVLHVL